MARTLTFLFTDIEGSTRLWEQEGERMGAWVAMHDLVLKKAVEESSGTIFKHVGDGICAVFDTASCALDAAVRAQVALQEQARELRVRVAIHTGAVETRDGDFFGPPLNRVARLMASGHGGQILLSQACVELAQDSLPPGTSLKSLGVHRLRDLERAEHVYQLLHPDLPEDFEDLRTLDFLPNNLPQQLTSFIGREKELAQVQRLLSGCRLLTLTGSGGAGKTRLSLQLAAEVFDDFPQGVWFVELAPISDPELVVQAIASAVGQRDSRESTLIDAVLGRLRDWSALVVLDNCEHLIGAVASAADLLLRSCPKLKILATSREPLNVLGEIAWRIPPLSLPSKDKMSTPESLGAFEAVKLFIERASTVSPSFAVTNANAPCVAQICYDLDGIPLAIELAAARTRALSVEQIAARLGDRFGLLTGGSRTAMARQQTLRATIDWSHDLLSEQERVAFRRLAVFAGSFAMEAAEEVIAYEPLESWEVLDLLTQLLDKSLLAAESSDGNARYRMLETVHRYADEKLEAAAETERTRANHHRFYHRLVDMNFDLFYRRQQQTWFVTLDIEFENIRQALGHASSVGDWTSVASIAGHLHPYWDTRGRIDEGLKWLDRALQHEVSKPGVRLRALATAGRLSAVLCDYAKAEQCYGEGMKIAKELNDQQFVAEFLSAQGLLEIDRDRDEVAQPLLEEALALRKQLGDAWGTAAALTNVGITYMDLGDVEKARTVWREAISRFEQVGDNRAIATLSNNLGLAELMFGDINQSEEMITKSLRTQEMLGNRTGAALSRSNLARVYWKMGRYSEALSCYRNSLQVYRMMGDRHMMLSIVLDTGAMATDAGDYYEAVILLAGAKKQYAATGGAPPRITVGDADKAWETAAERLPESALKSALREAEGMDFDTLIRRALDTPTPQPAAAV